MSEKNAHIANGSLTNAPSPKCYIISEFVHLNLINSRTGKSVVIQVRKKGKKKGVVVKPILTNAFRKRGQVDLIDMQSEPDRDYKFILNYQDHFTKFLFLRPLKTKTGEDVSYNLMDIFCIIGAPCILQSDNGREFSNKIIKELACMFEAKIVNGKPRHSQSQGSVERANQDVRDMLVTWMADNQTSQWAEGLRIVQMKRNRTYHRGITRSPYEALFGVPLTNGLPQELCCSTDLETEEQLEEVLTNIPESNHETDSSDSENSDVSILQKRKKLIEEKRADCAKKMKKQADEMLRGSDAKFPPMSVDQNVVLRIPELDRGRAAPRNVIAVIMEVNDDGLYKLGTKSGILEKLYSRNEFQQTEDNFISEKDVPNFAHSLRTTVTLESGSSQGFVHCNCRKQCDSKRCKCLSTGIKCNSKCHHSSACRNK